MRLCASSYRALPIARLISPQLPHSTLTRIHNMTKGQQLPDFQVGMCGAMCAAPCYCCLGCFCAPCFACHQRLRVLQGAEYRCCAGTIPCCTCKMPECCLCCEVFFCLSCAVSSTRIVIQERYGINNSCCDQCILWTSCICSCLASCMGGQRGDEARCFANFLYLSVVGCMQAQQEHELDLRSHPKRQQMR